MPWVKLGKERWRVRVDLFVEAGVTGLSTGVVARSLTVLLTGCGRDLEHGGVAGMDKGRRDCATSGPRNAVLG